MPNVLGLRKSTAVQGFLVGGAWRTGSGRTFQSIHPADGSVVATIAEAENSDVDAAVAAAQTAYRDSEWRGLKSHQRAKLLYRFAEEIDRNAERLAVLQTSDNGKAIGESRTQSRVASECFRYYAALCETVESAVVPERGDYFSFTWNEPVGVVAAITPWNSPIALESQKLAPALAAGNCVILKPSEITPQVGLAFGQLALDAGFPPGVVNVLSGSGATVGRALVKNPGIDLVTFTGGTTTGREIARIAGGRLIPCIVELGGKSPNVIFNDADIDAAVTGTMFAIFSSCGQACIAGSRIFVQEKIYDRFVAELVRRTGELKIGDPFDPKTAIAPAASFEHRAKIEDYIEIGRAEGGDVIAGGSRPSGEQFKNGAYIQPTLIATDNKARVSQEEIFGPVGVIIRFRDEDDLIQKANETTFGLACGIWTGDYKRALRVAKSVRAGTIWINTYKLTAVNMPFGGFRDSGLWRECGVQGLKNYMENKSVYMNLDTQPIKWPPPL